MFGSSIRISTQRNNEKCMTRQLTGEDAKASEEAVCNEDLEDNTSGELQSQDNTNHFSCPVSTEQIR